MTFSHALYRCNLKWHKTTQQWGVSTMCVAKMMHRHSCFSTCKAVIKIYKCDRLHSYSFNICRIIWCQYFCTNDGTTRGYIVVFSEMLLRSLFCCYVFTIVVTFCEMLHFLCCHCALWNVVALCKLSLRFLFLLCFTSHHSLGFNTCKETDCKYAQQGN